MVAVAAADAGCVDPRKDYDDFGNKLVDASTVDIDGMIVSTLPDITGDWYMGARPDLPEDRIIELVVTFTFTPVTTNTGTLSYSGTFLDVTTHEPVGDPLSDDGVAIGADGQGEYALAGQLPAAANPVTGSNANIDATMQIELRSADFVCGTADGAAGGLSLAGTTWSAVRITDPGTLPTLTWNCDQQPTAP